MIVVNITNNSDEAFERAFNIFTKQCSKDGFIQELKDRRYFKKPSEKKREKARRKNNK